MINYSIEIKEKIVQDNKIVSIYWSYIGNNGKIKECINNNLVKDFDINTTDNEIIEALSQEYNFERLKIQIEIQLK